MKKAYTFNDLLKSKIEKFNPYHDRRGRFTSKGGGGGSSMSGGASSKGKRDYGLTNCSDALDEIKSGKENSLSAHMDANGNLTPEREAVHKQIIDDWLAGKTGVEGQAEMRMMGGGPASGKGSVDPIIGTFDEKHHVKVDPDYFKEKLPGYEEMTKKTDKAASFYHEESSALAKRAYEVALKENLNVTYDGTGDGSEKSVMKKINAAREKGYRVTGEYVSVDVDVAIQRNQARYDHAKAQGKPARKPPEDYVKSCHQKVTDISVSMAKHFDNINVWDNNGPKGSTKLIATGGNGKDLTAIKGEEAAFAKYLAKGSKK